MIDDVLCHAEVDFYVLPISEVGIRNQSIVVVLVD